MKPRIATILAVLGIGLAFTGSLATIITMWDGFQMAASLAGGLTANSSQLSALIAETIVAVFTRGVLLLLPAILLYLAFFPLGQKDTGYFRTAKFASIAMMLAVPVGTVAGGILYFMLRRLQRRDSVSSQICVTPKPDTQKP